MYSTLIHLLPSLYNKQYMKRILISDLTTNVNINEDYYDSQTLGMGPGHCMETIVSVVKRKKGTL